MYRWIVVGMAGCSGGETPKTPWETAETGTVETGTVETGTVETGTPPSLTVVDGEGFACLYGPEGSGDNPHYGNYNGTTNLVDGGTTEVQVIFTTCASCPTEIETSCTAALQGSDIVVNATGSYVPPGQETSCASVCVLVTAVCQGPSLPGGAYTISYNGTSSPLTVPGTEQVACAGDRSVR